MLIVAQVTAIARAELRKGTALVPGKGSLRLVDGFNMYTSLVHLMLPINAKIDSCMK